MRSKMEASYGQTEAAFGTSREDETYTWFFRDAGSLPS